MMKKNKMMKPNLMLILIATAAISIGCKKEGCTDPLANNYNKKADIDDASCTYDESVISLEITEDITVPTTFEAKNIKICSDISVSSQLTVMPGAKLIMCEGSSITIENSGYFSAVGTAEKPIIIKGETETAGFWTGIAFKSNNPNNKLIHTTVKDAGTYWGWEYANVYVSNTAQLNISNSTISNSEDVGLFIASSGSLSAFSNNIFSNNKTGLSLQASQVSKLDGDSQYNVGNINNFVWVRDGDIDVAATWKATSTPLLVHGLDVSAGLTLEPGTNIQMEGDSHINVTTSGFINSEGTAAAPINIKGRYTSPAFWEGMRITSNNPNNIFKFTNIEDGGGYWGYEYSNILVTGRIDISNSTVKNANSWGVFVGSSASIYNNGTVQTTVAGVEASNTITGNGTGPNANCTTGCSVFFD